MFKVTNGVLSGGVLAVTLDASTAGALAEPVTIEPLLKLTVAPPVMAIAAVVPSIVSPFVSVPPAMDTPLAPLMVLLFVSIPPAMDTPVSPSIVLLFVSVPLSATETPVVPVASAVGLIDPAPLIFKVASPETLTPVAPVPTLTVPALVRVLAPDLPTMLASGAVPVTPMVTFCGIFKVPPSSEMFLSG